MQVRPGPFSVRRLCPVRAGAVGESCLNGSRAAAGVSSFAARLNRAKPGSPAQPGRAMGPGLIYTAPRPALTVMATSATPHNERNYEVDGEQVEIVSFFGGLTPSLT